MESSFVNKVAESGILTLDLLQFYPAAHEVMLFDLKPFLFMELILKEKDFREALKLHDWEAYRGLKVGVTCSVDAIIPVWAYMLVASYLQPVASDVFMVKQGDDLRQQVLLRNISTLSAKEYADKRVVVKGCGDIAIDAAAYLAVTAVLRPEVKSIMYGEPCSTVPIYKKRG